MSFILPKSQNEFDKTTNILCITPKHIEFIFTCRIKKNDLPLYHKQYNKESITEMFGMYYCMRYYVRANVINETTYCTQVPYSYYKFILYVMKELICKGCFVNYKIILKIGNYGVMNEASVENFLLELAELNCIWAIIFNKECHMLYCDLRNFVGIQHIRYNGAWIKNMHFLPSNTKLVEFKAKPNVSKLIDVVSGTENLLIHKEKTGDILKINLSHVSKIETILLVNSRHMSERLQKLSYEGIILNCYPNTFINIRNLPHIKFLWIYFEFYATLDYLPNSLEKIAFEGNVKSSLCNIPSSVKTLCFGNFTMSENFQKLSELPDFVEILQYNGSLYGTSEINPKHIDKLPHSLKRVEIYNYHSKDRLIAKFDNYKQKFGANFDIVLID